MKTRLLIVTLAVTLLVACAQKSSETSVAALPPWGRCLMGLLLIVLPLLLLSAYANGKLEIEGPLPFSGRPATENDGCMIGFGALIMFVIGILLIVSAVGGGVGGTVASWLDSYSRFYGTLETGLQVAGFLIIEIIILALMVGSGLRILFSEEDRKDSLIFFLFWGTLNGAYWTWVFWTHRFEELFVQPFTSIYHLFFK